MVKTSAEIAIELRGKFEFFLLGLTFGVLGLSIQTAEFGASLFLDALELVGWLALFVSGVIGLLRAEWIPVAYDIQSKIHRMTGQRADVRHDLERGRAVQVPFIESGTQTMVPGPAAVTRLDQLLATLERQHDDANEKIIRRYNVMRSAFVVGIACLLVARGTPPAVSIAERLVPFLRSLAAG